MRYAYGFTAALLLTGSTFALINGNSATAQAVSTSPVTNTGIAPRGAPDSFADLTDQLQPAVVNIQTKQEVTVAGRGNPFFGRSAPQTREQISGGSGFIISSDGLIVTNNHVIVGGNNGDVVDEVTVIFADGKEYQAEIVGRDAQSDLALLKIDATGLAFVELEREPTSRVGDWVIAIGNPLGLGSTVTAGIVSALQRNIGAGGAYDRFIQTDTAINRGNSGGPLFNLQGKVVGINNRLISPVAANIGINFAIPSEEAFPVIEALKSGKQVERGYLGVSIQPVDAATAEALGLEKNRGETVGVVRKGDAADKAGIIVGDIITKINGLEVKPDQTLSFIIANIKPGTKVPIELLRKGKPTKLDVIVGKRPTEEQIAQADFNPDEEKDFDEQRESDSSNAQIIRDALGIRVIPFTPDIARAMGADDEITGVIIDIAGRGPAAQAGLLRADVITSVNYKAVTTPEELAAQIKAVKELGRKNALLGVRRRGGELRYVTVRLGGS